MPNPFYLKIKKVFVVVVLLTTITRVSEGQIYEKYSNVESALLIDSLENVLTDDKDNPEIIYNLAMLYYNIDKAQAKKYSYLFLNNTKPNSIENNANIYILLSSIYSQEGIADSALYFLKEYDWVSSDLYQTKLSEISNKYISSDTDKNEVATFRVLIIYLVIIILLLVVLFLSYYFLSKHKKRLKLIEKKKNAELEEANIKLQQFKSDLQEAVMEKSYNKALEYEEIANEIVKFKKSLKKDEDAIYLKNAFLGSMSHQIRTPLSGIMGFSNILETEFAIKGNEELYEYARNIEESGEKLMSLITNIIDISSIEANLLELKPVLFDLNELINTQTKDYEIKAKGKGLIFKTKLNTGISKCFADSHNVLKVLKIVLNNAMQYTAKGFVTVSTDIEDKGHVIIEINDTGNGIDEKTLKLLKESFDYSRSGSSMTYEGNGLGLILAHRLVYLMKGELKIIVEHGKGTSVSIILPADNVFGQTNDINDQIANDDKNQDISMVSAPELGRISILVVEDDRMNRMVIEKMLKKAGNIIIVKDGDDALKKFEELTRKKKTVDVVLMDINLPEPWDGLKLLQKIRSDYIWTKRIPFIAQTAYAMAGDKDMYLEAGFDDYISKPINKNELLTMIQKQLEVSSKND